MTFRLSSTELFILEILAGRGGYMKTADIVLVFKKKRPNTPKQTVYRAISSLKKKEAVVIAQGFTSVNTHWIGMARQKLDVLESYSLHQSLPDKFSYIFPSFLAFAPVFTHHANVMINQADVAKPILFLNPHQWFYVAREWSEDQLVDRIEAEGRTLWQGISHVSDMDRLILQKKFTNRPTILGSFITARDGEEDVYINVIGDFVIKVTTTSEFAQTINKIYDNNKEITDEVISQIEDALRYSGPVKMVVKRNPRLADDYRRLMKKFIG